MSLREAAYFVLKDAKNSRYPVYGKDLDDIIGTVHMRDVLFHAENLQESRMEIANVPGVLRAGSFYSGNPQHQLPVQGDAVPEDPYGDCHR